MDVVTAIEGPDEAFRCTEIRRRGLGERCPQGWFEGECAVSTAMRRAELAWRRSLAGQTIADVAAEAQGYAPTIPTVVRAAFEQG